MYITRIGHIIPCSYRADCLSSCKKAPCHHTPPRLYSLRTTTGVSCLLLKIARTISENGPDWQ